MEKLRYPEHPFNYKHAFIIMEVREHPDSEDVQMWIFKSLDPRQQELLEAMFPFTSTNKQNLKDTGKKFHNCFLLFEEELNKIFSTIIVCMCQQYQIL